MSAPYDPIPAPVRQAWAAFVAACKAHALSPSGPHLHICSLDEGEDIVVNAKRGLVSRYWPMCGASYTEPTVIAPSPPDVAARMLAAAAEAEREEP